jgi:hypothetical protein
VLGEENERERERNIAFPLKTPASIFIKEKWGTQSLYAIRWTREVHS